MTAVSVPFAPGNSSNEAGRWFAPASAALIGKQIAGQDIPLRQQQKNGGQRGGTVLHLIGVKYHCAARIVLIAPHQQREIGRCAVLGEGGNGVPRQVQREVQPGAFRLREDQPLELRHRGIEFSNLRQAQ